MHATHVTDVAKKEYLLNGLESCNGKDQLKQDFTFPYFKDGVTTKSGTTNIFVKRHGVQIQCVALAEKRGWYDVLNDKKIVVNPAAQIS
ncbi:MAG: hypothetical protein C5S38_07930 [Candidatus Methanophagaceae archaeon]|nr:MAG: hypothetical protein C5S38_07930 [Methanophagales archaeon]KAF5429885.1 hypothetical protein C5S36_14500 [Methanophagales archaeon]